MKERRQRGNVEKDLLGVLMGSTNDEGDRLSDDQIADNIIGVLFAAQDTTASALTWILKYLYDNNKVLEAVKVAGSRGSSSSILTVAMSFGALHHGMNPAITTAVTAGRTNVRISDQRGWGEFIDLGADEEHAADSEGE